MKKYNLCILVFLLMLFFLGESIFSQGYCRVTVEGVNRDRHIPDVIIDTECEPEGWPIFPHSVPFGNWGVASNFGDKEDGHQFEGWCHVHYACDNFGACDTYCRDEWYEWNSCTNHIRFIRPNIGFYNDEDWTEQQTATGVNAIDSITLMRNVECPRDTNMDGTCDVGGCKGVYSVSSYNNFMSLYELDRVWPDQLVQTLYYGNLYIDASSCGIYGCGGQPTSQWKEPSSFDPDTGQLVEAEMAIRILGAAYIDTVDCEYLRFANPEYQCY